MSQPHATEDDLLDHRAIIAACLRHGVPFLWHGPGLLLIAPHSFGAVIADVTEQGFRVLGLDGFVVDPTIRTRLDLSIDNTAGHELTSQHAEQPRAHAHVVARVVAPEHYETRSGLPC